MNRNPYASDFESGRFLPVLVVLFVGSGCAALIYEVIWFQMLQLVVGLTSVSLGILLGTFMGGMCIGSIFLPRLIGKKHHPMMVYAILELGIGLFGMAILFGMPLINRIYTGIAGYGLYGSILFRAVIAAICLLPPTILMGATLPAISRWVRTNPRGVSWMGFFYVGNTFGAVAGSLLAGFFLLRLYDTYIATYVAVCLNILVAAGAMVVSRLTGYNSGQENNSPQMLRNLKKSPVYFTIALSGLAALGAEVIWTRLLSIMLGSTVYTFTIILAVFLIGLGTGSGAGAYGSRRLKSPELALGVCQFMLIIGIAWTSYMIRNSTIVKPLDINDVSDAWFDFQMNLARTVLAIFPTVLFWGASFPLALAAVASEGQDPGRLVGGVYAANTVGAILGSLVFSLIGIPLLGTSVSQKWLIVISTVSALLMLLYVRGTKRMPVSSSPQKILSPVNVRFAGLFAVVLLVMMLALGSIRNVHWTTIAFGRQNITFYNMLAAKSTTGFNDMTPLYVGEGLNGSVVVTQTREGYRQFHSVGKVQASTKPEDMRLQRMLGHITALLTGEIESVFVVACGAGITSGSFITYPGVKSMVICDIEPLVPKVVAPMFSYENYGIADGIAEENPHTVNGKKVQFIYDDGRHYISTSDEKYDIISCDPIDPWAKGAAALYTVEYFEICKSHLKPGGTMSLWVPLYESSEESAKSLIASFFKAFPNGLIWSNDIHGVGYDLVLFGQVEPSHFDIERLEEKLNSSEYSMVRQSIEEVGFYNLEELLGTYAGRAKDLKMWLSDAQINTDKNLRLSYLAGTAINSGQATEILQDIMSYYAFPKDLFSGAEDKLESLNQSILNKKH